MIQKPIVRFAPSPTGYLHVGNIRTAIVNWLFVEQEGGQFILRMDDTDQERSKPEFEAAIREDMQWLGMEWVREERQTERIARYTQAMQQLIQAGRLYACYDTPEELEVRRKLLVSRGKPPVYDRAALKVTDEQKKQYEAEGRKPHWRFLLNDAPIAWDDLVRGRCEFQGAHASDPVLVREDGVPLYTFSSVVDDIDMDITHIIRGEDHVSNSAVQIQIFEALGGKPPVFAHLALLRTKEGELSKRKGGGDIRSLRQRGFLPLSILSYLAKLGTSDSVELADSRAQLVEQFSFTKFGRSAAQYDEEELLRLNAKLLHRTDFSAVEAQLKDLGVATDANFWNAIRENLHTVTEAKDWWELVYQPVTPVIADAEYTTKAVELLPADTAAADSWKNFTNSLKDSTGRKGKELFMPLRLALTAREDGPDLSQVFRLLGRERITKRLMGEAA